MHSRNMEQYTQDQEKVTNTRDTIVRKALITNTIVLIGTAGNELVDRVSNVVVWMLHYQCNSR